MFIFYRDLQQNLPYEVSQNNICVISYFFHTHYTYAVSTATTRYPGPYLW